jgi:hypothetical protein
MCWGNKTHVLVHLCCAFEAFNRSTISRHEQLGDWSIRQPHHTRLAAHQNMPQAQHVHAQHVHAKNLGCAFLAEHNRMGQHAGWQAGACCFVHRSGCRSASTPTPVRRSSALPPVLISKGIQQSALVGMRFTQQMQYNTDLSRPT